MGISPKFFVTLHLEINREVTCLRLEVSMWFRKTDRENMNKMCSFSDCVRDSKMMVSWQAGGWAQGWSMYKALAGFNTQHHSKRKLSGKNIWEEDNGLTLEIQSRRGAGNGGVRLQKHISFKDPFHYEVVLTFWVWSAIANQIQCIIKYLLYCF